MPSPPRHCTGDSVPITQPCLDGCSDLFDRVVSHCTFRLRAYPSLGPILRASCLPGGNSHRHLDQLCCKPGRRSCSNPRTLCIRVWFEPLVLSPLSSPGSASKMRENGQGQPGRDSTVAESLPGVPPGRLYNRISSCPRSKYRRANIWCICSTSSRLRVHVCRGGPRSRAL